MPEIKKYLNRDGLEEYNSLLPHSSGKMQEYVNDWLDEHPEATTTVQDGAITEPKLADKSVSLRTLADDTVHMLKGMMLTREISGEVLTADDAYSAPPVALTVEGKSTQDGTPTPDAPVEIVSVEQVTLHASADGTTDAANWPVLLLLTAPLRSLPDSTHDALTLSYLRPSTREGWAWYTGDVTRRVSQIDLGNLKTLYGGANNNVFYKRWSSGSDGAAARVALNAKGAICQSFAAGGATSLAAARSKPANTIMLCQTGDTGVMVNVPTSDYPTVAAFTTAFTGIIAYYPLATPTTETLPEIELPVLPAPDVTIWSDPSTGLQMEYVRDSSLVIQRIEEAIADQ